MSAKKITIGVVVAFVVLITIGLIWLNYISHDPGAGLDVDQGADQENEISLGDGPFRAGEWPIETFDAQVNDMEVTYHITEEIPESVQSDDWFELDNEGVCNIYFTREYLDKSNGPTFNAVANALAGCYYDGEEYDVERSEYMNWWLALYNIDCGRRLEPFGWKYASDGACEVPTFESAYEAM